MCFGMSVSVVQAITSFKLWIYAIENNTWLPLRNYYISRYGCYEICKA